MSLPGFPDNSSCIQNQGFLFMTRPSYTKNVNFIYTRKMIDLKYTQCAECDVKKDWPPKIF